MGFRRSEVRILSPRHCKPRCNNKLQRGFFMERSACPAEGRESGRECFSRTPGAYNGTSGGCCLSRRSQVTTFWLTLCFRNRVRRFSNAYSHQTLVSRIERRLVRRVQRQAGPARQGPRQREG